VIVTIIVVVIIVVIVVVIIISTVHIGWDCNRWDGVFAH
jgi:hypothetical protein